MDTTNLNPFRTSQNDGNHNPYQSPADVPDDDGFGMVTRAGGRLNPWFSMWTKPRATIRQILEAYPDRLVWVIASITGINQMLQSISGSGIIEHIPLMGAIGGCVALGPLAGAVSLVISSLALRVTGRWLGGVGDVREVRSAVAWCSVPTVWSMLLWIPLIGLFGADLFRQGFWPEPEMLVPYYIILTVSVIIGIWQFVVMLKCVGEAHQFSAWRAWGAMIIFGLLMTGLIIGVVLIAVVILAFTMAV